MYLGGRIGTDKVIFDKTYDQAVSSGYGFGIWYIKFPSSRLNWHNISGSMMIFIMASIVDFGEYVWR